MEKKLSIQNMTCMHCLGRVKKFLEQNNDISNVVVDLEAGEACFTVDKTLDMDAIIKGITELGYPAGEKQAG